MVPFVTFVVLLLCQQSLGRTLTLQNQENKELHPDTGLNVLEIIERYGYPIERHTVTTEDGYVLEMHRIPHGLNNANETNKPVVLVMHGLMSSSADWCNNGGPEKSICFLLADRGYDVWMGNARGNSWSRKHVTLDPDADEDQFWNFSWNEIGYYDLPAKIDYIIAQTQVDAVFYIGHSQGTTSFFVMASERPEYNSKIKLMSALAPVAYMNHMTNPFVQLVATFEGQLEWIMQFLGINEFLPHSDLLELIGLVACQDGAAFQDICSNILFLIAGFDSEQLDETLIPVYTTNAPAGAASKQFLHYGQEVNSGKFRKWDYGFVGNLEHYGQDSPPDYNLGMVSAPVALYYSSNDWLAAVEDVDHLYTELGHVLLKYHIPFEKFNHLDFIWAIDINELLYDRVLEFMERFQ